ncbi:hypothetical protein [Candidatus Berkiella aquae]|uniref:Uncharacterized protein n=1 Tax=Candidatus Berkiella aquae TaxID=295108 RepID=A0A0Q9YW65_9GAMM|nr:hypothetical protein [Candidatus Berkiella aquae]MCS5711342.1 hypothetical protein [Candidatus Berkiella aquae]
MLAGTTSTDTHFTDAQTLLYILTGQRPEKTVGTIDKLRQRGEHLRFTFSDQKQDFFQVLAMLKLLGIPHCPDLYKNVGNKENPRFEYYISVAPQQFNMLFNFVNPDAMHTLCKEGERLQFDTSELPLLNAQLNILFDKSILEKISERNQDKYSLDGLMYYIAKLTMNSMPCFAHLEKSGIQFEATVEQSDNEEAKEMSEHTTPKLVLTQFTQSKKRRVTESSDSANELVVSDEEEAEVEASKGVNAQQAKRPVAK